MTARLAHARSVARHRGGPLVMLALLVTGWCSARVMWWENPFAYEARASAEAFAAVAVEHAPALALPAAATLPALPALAVASAVLPVTGRLPTFARRTDVASLEGLPGVALASGLSASASAQSSQGGDPLLPPTLPVQPPFLAVPLVSPRAAPGGRWSLDAWAFWRQGSSAAPVSQGRVPVYGASQAGAVLQYRLAPRSRTDPRLYARAYRALVRRGENEGALGASLRPLAWMPIRVAGEVRYTDAAFFNQARPAAYAVTELPPLRMPYGVALEAYGQAGWVGGRGATPFADGQASLTRDLPLVARLTDERLRLNLGAGAWGGAQEGAQRVDIGPTLRLDTRLGKAPARLSVDWRLRVAGDAAPGSGVAATVSTGF